MIREDADITRFAGIGEDIAAAIREIVLTGTLGKLEKLRGQPTPALADLSAHPRLDPKRVMRIYKSWASVQWRNLKSSSKTVPSKRPSAHGVQGAARGGPRRLSAAMYGRA